MNTLTPTDLILLKQALCDAMGVDATRITRIVIDIESHGLPRVYLVGIGGEELFHESLLSLLRVTREKRGGELLYIVPEGPPPNEWPAENTAGVEFFEVPGVKVTGNYQGTDADRPVEQGGTVPLPESPGVDDPYPDHDSSGEGPAEGEPDVGP